MKKPGISFVGILGLTVLLAGTLPSLFAGSTYNRQGVEFVDGHVSNAPSGEPVFTSEFATAAQWSKPANYRNQLDISFGKEFMGEKCLVVSGKKLAKSDTAWNLVSQLVKLPRKAPQFVLSFEVCSANVPLKGALPGGKVWSSAVLWYNAANELCGEQTFSYPISHGFFSETVVNGEIPTNAVAFAIQLGFDSPNIDEGNEIAFRQLEFSIIDPNNKYIRTSRFESEICAGGDISWTARTPERTYVKFQVATAANVDGEPGTWSKFCGPDGTDKSFYTEPFKVDAAFVRYRVFLIPAGSVRPVLTSVTVGDKCEKSWTDRVDVFPPRVKIVSPTPTLQKQAEVALQITDDLPIMWKTIKITVDKEDMTKSFIRDGNRLTLTPTSDWSDGLHTVIVEVSDARKNAVTAKKCFFIGSSPKTPKVTLRDDGMTLIDGKPFFPIGLYGVMKREFNNFDLDKAFQGLKAAGFNFAHSYNVARTDEFLAAALKYDFKLWSVARFPDERFIEIERNHPAIIAWYLGDDTSANTTPSELFDRDDAVKAVDPTRITTQADVVGGHSEISNYRDYVHGTDNFLPEIYPVRTTDPEEGARCVAQVIFDMERCQADIAASGATVKSLWPIIQYFKGWGWQRFPTMQELRGMSFASIVHGAHGITWYTYGGLVNYEKKKFNYGVTSTPEHWKNISTVATQIKTISPALLERTPKEQPSVTILSGPKTDYYGKPSVTCLLKKHDGFFYVIAVNASHEPVEVAFAVGGNGTVEVLFENRNVPLKEGRIRDSFKGHDVHVYKWKM